MGNELNIIEVLNSNVRTEYEATTPKGYKYNCVVELEQDNKVLINSKDGLKIDCLNDFIINTKFIPIQKPVPFMEAVKAFSEGKVIECELNTEKFVYGYKYKKQLIDSNKLAVSINEILNGKWYIKEELVNEK